jgi:hypothetical protein
VGRTARIEPAGAKTLSISWAWAAKPLDSPLTIAADIYDAVMALPPEERRDRANVNEAVREDQQSLKKNLGANAGLTKIRHDTGLERTARRATLSGRHTSGPGQATSATRRHGRIGHEQIFVAKTGSHWTSELIAALSRARPKKNPPA